MNVEDVLNSVAVRLITTEGLEEIKNTLEANLESAHNDELLNREAVIRYCNTELPKIYKELVHRKYPVERFHPCKG